MVGSLVLALALRTGLDPIETGQELTWLGSAPWAKVALIITAAVFVLSLGGMLAKRKPGRRGLLGGRRDFSLEIARLESLPCTPISEALDGPVHFEGVLASASETLGGEPGKERVYFNRAGAGRRSAVASELVLLRDDSGQVSIEGLDSARVIAAKERRDPARPNSVSTISLKLGDRVQVLGYFRGEVHGHDEAATERVYGVLGEGQQIQVREVPEAEIKANSQSQTEAASQPQQSDEPSAPSPSEPLDEHPDV